MKKAILTVGLFSLMMILTSFRSPEIGGQGTETRKITEIGGQGTETRKDIGGQGTETRGYMIGDDKTDIGGQGTETRKDIGGQGTETRS